MHPKDVREDDYITSGLHEPVYHYFDYTKHRGYVASGCTGSTSPTSRVKGAAARRRLVVDYFA
jgi:hypothetical protein